MFSRWADSALRLGSGLSLLLLLVAQAKACPSIVTPPAHTPPAADDASSGDTSRPTDKRRRPKQIITIYHALPELPDYRRTCERSREALRDSELFGTHAEISAVTPLRAAPAAAAAICDDAGWWTRFLPALHSSTYPERFVPVRLQDMLATVISRVGPPAA